MNLKSVVVPLSITTGYQDPNKDFFTPILSVVNSFDVAVGYFTSGWLMDVLDGMHKLALSGGYCRFIVSPVLDPEDALILVRESSHLGPQIVEKKLLEEISLLDISKRELLSNLISCGVCDFKIATPKELGSNLFHAKIGYASDKNENQLAFNGSFNFTASAKSNWEYIDIYTDETERDKLRIDSIRRRFESLWLDEDVFYDVNSPSVDMLNSIEHYTSDSKKKYPKRENIHAVKLREYQQDAIREWARNDGRGMLVMATGSGKTITALSAVKKVVDKFIMQKKPLFIVFILPLKHLLDQWADEAKAFNFDVVKCYETSDIWMKSLGERLAHQAIHNDGIVMAMITNSSLASSKFQKIIKGNSVPMMVVADEAHNLGSTIYLDSLPQKALLRLGLTATPERYNDPEGEDAIIKYFDRVVFEFSLADAINAGYLVKYIYHPFICEFNNEEFIQYKSICAKLEAEETSLVEAENKLELIRDAASNKLILLRIELEKLLLNNALKHTLIYCGAYRDQEGSRQIEKITKMLGAELGVKVRKFTSDESVSERKDILNQFSLGELDCLVAIKCLDEGVDVPATRQAFVLSSTSNPREYIQRRGRVLRRCIGKEEAIIYDFIMVPPPGEVNTYLVTREVKRAIEYNSLAINKEDNEPIIERLISEHEVEIIF